MLQPRRIVGQREPKKVNLDPYEPSRPTCEKKIQSGPRLFETRDYVNDEKKKLAQVST